MSARARGPRGHSIGAVLATLQPDFPDVSISKIRFLEAEGLVAPERTASGYRSFSDADVERLRFILTAQRDRFWPLKVIREALEALDRGLTLDGGVGTGLPSAPADQSAGLPSAAELTARPSLRLTRAELLQAAGIDDSALASLVTFGLVASDAGGHFDSDALAVARSAGALAAYGVEPRHLRAFRTAADREVGLVEAIVSPARAAGQPDPTGEVLAHCLALHTALVRTGLRR